MNYIPSLVDIASLRNSEFKVYNRAQG